jgi:hypothetical protein
MEVYDVVMKLVGPVRPVGETDEDNRRYENLKNLTQLMDLIHTEIDEISYLYRNDPRFSVKRAGEHCNKFLTKMGIEE